MSVLHSILVLLLATRATAIPVDSKDSVFFALRRVVADTSKVVNFTRNYDGDVFYSNDVTECNTDTCVGLSSGTADLYAKNNVNEIDLSESSEASECKCKCLPHIKTYREDFGICVDDIRECTLASFSSGSVSEKIPFVYLPLHGQIINPGKEIKYHGLNSSVCEVRGAQYLSKHGWNELRSPTQVTNVFALVHDDRSAFLQWLGDATLRSRMRGRLIVVHLVCHPKNVEDIHYEEDDLAVSASNINEIFYPCLAFRVVGTPTQYIQNIAEVTFGQESQPETPFFSFTSKEFIMIATASLCLGVIYTASVCFYLHICKRKKRNGRLGGDKGGDCMYAKNDQVTFGAGISQTMFERQCASSLGCVDPSRPGLVDAEISEEVGIVKSNPLLTHFASIGGVGASDNSGCVSDTSNPNSEFDDDFSIEQIADGVALNKKTSVTPLRSSPSKAFDSFQSTNVTQESECLPQEDVSITEDILHNEELENIKSMINGSSRRKLYFNPAYFEPHLLSSPPPAAVEFLTKIREVISIAKYKMATKRFQPSLIVIPEEKLSDNYENCKGGLSAGELKQKKTCASCSGFASHSKSPKAECKNCGEKQKSIQKWLEGVSTSHDNGSESCEKNTPESPGTYANFSAAEKATGRTIRTPYNGALSSPLSSIYCSVPNSETYSKHEALSSKHDGQSSRSSSVAKSGKMASFYEATSQVDAKSVRSESNYGIRSLYGGSEIYNNPQFDDLPVPVVEEPPPKPPSKPPRADASSLKRKPGQMPIEVINKMNKMPDMVHEAIASDYNRIYNRASPHLPTPDYGDDESNNGTFRRIHERLQKSYHWHEDGPQVPTPDYNTLGRRTPKKLCAPDSPIYSRKSPFNLVVDYETDSLERSTEKRKSATPPSEGSHVSPSLSSALPLEEEVEIRNAVYDRVGSGRERRRSLEPNIKYNTPFFGSMTIEVEHSPDEFDLSTDSDQFEPDTLDRKTKRRGKLSSINGRPTTYFETSGIGPESGMCSLPDMSHHVSAVSLHKAPEKPGNAGLRRSFESLRELYEVKPPPQPDKGLQKAVDQGRILTLEVRHSKRQRHVDVKFAPPDLIPSDQKDLRYLRQVNSLDGDSVASDSTTLTGVSEQPETRKTSQEPRPSKNLPYVHHPKDPKDRKALNFDRSISKLPITTKIFRVEVPQNTDIRLAIKVNKDQTGKTSKDIKNAWRRFIDLAGSRFSKQDSKQDLDKMILTDSHDDLGKVLEHISDKSALPGALQALCRDPDLGYMSADSNELRNQNKKLYEKLFFEKYEASRREQCKSRHFVKNPKSFSEPQKRPFYMSPPAPPSRPPPAPPILKSCISKPLPDDKNALNVLEKLHKAMNADLSGPDEGPGDHTCESSESDEEFVDLCESGAESVETHSVFYKNIRKNSKMS